VRASGLATPWMADGQLVDLSFGDGRNGWGLPNYLLPMRQRGSKEGGTMRNWQLLETAPVDGRTITGCALVEAVSKVAHDDIAKPYLAYHRQSQ
jgi:hypothetical protein